MSEYVAIRIDFTLQGLYTCTHSPRIQSTSYSNCLRSIETKLTATAPFLSPQVGMQPLRGWGALELCGPARAIRSSTKRPCSSRIGPPRTILLLTGLVTRIASSDWIHHHSG